MLGKQMSVYFCKYPFKNVFIPETEEAFIWWGAEQFLSDGSLVGPHKRF